MADNNNKYTLSGLTQIFAGVIANVTTHIGNEICAEYCKYPNMYENETKLYEERCKKCPLNLL